MLIGIAVPGVVGAEKVQVWSKCPTARNMAAAIVALLEVHKRPRGILKRNRRKTHNSPDNTHLSLGVIWNKP